MISADQDVQFKAGMVRGWVSAVPDVSLQEVSPKEFVNDANELVLSWTFGSRTLSFYIMARKPIRCSQGDASTSEPVLYRTTIDAASLPSVLEWLLGMADLYGAPLYSNGVVG